MMCDACIARSGDIPLSSHVPILSTLILTIAVSGVISAMSSVYVLYTWPGYTVFIYACIKYTLCILCIHSVAVPVSLPINPLSMPVYACLIPCHRLAFLLIVGVYPPILKTLTRFKITLPMASQLGVG